MTSRELKQEQPAKYFAVTHLQSSEVDEGTRDMFPLAPFIVAGGKNTERYYFMHVNDYANNHFKFNIRPQYFGDEAAYTEVFPKRINEILSKNTGAKVFCLWDMDTIVGNTTLEQKHEDFLRRIDGELTSGQVVLCESMPSFEFWLLLHFVDYEGLLKDYPKVSCQLAPHLKPYFSKPSEELKRLLKKEKYVKETSWVWRLLDEGRLNQAIARAKICEARGKENPGCQSYTNVYKVF